MSGMDQKVKRVQGVFNCSFKTAQKIRRIQLEKQELSLEVKDLKAQLASKGLGSDVDQILKRGRLVAEREDFREKVRELESQYSDLLNEVVHKIPDVSRHDRAKQIIRSHENQENPPVKQEKDT